VMRASVTKYRHDSRQCCIRPGAHVQRFHLHPYRLDPDHPSSSCNQAAQAPAADAGQSMVSRRPRLRICIRIGRSGCPVALGPVMETGTKVGPLTDALVPLSVIRAVLPTASFNQRRSKFALSFHSSATPASDAPGTWRAATACALNSAGCRLRRRLLFSSTSVRLFQ
jgi:hypothetical protein